MYAPRVRQAPLLLCRAPSIAPPKKPEKPPSSYCRLRSAPRSHRVQAPRELSLKMSLRYVLSGGTLRPGRTNSSCRDWRTSPSPNARHDCASRAMLLRDQASACGFFSASSSSLSLRITPILLSRAPAHQLRLA